MSSKTFKLTLCLALTCAFSFAEETDSVDEESVPTNFVRDVMQPMGMPVVSSYHAMRESLFLNTKVKNGNALEALGDFFLAPSRYLFGGKTIKIKNADDLECEVNQNFHYDTMHWFKSLVCMIALPIGEVLGTTFKGLAYLSPEVRKRQRMIENALKSTKVVSHLEEYKEKGLPAFHGHQFIPCQGHKRPSTLTKKQKVEIQALKDMIELFEANNIIYWIDCGTCLGAYRYGGIIPWDWDIDIAIMLSDHENVKKLLSNLDPEKYQIQDWSSYSKPKTFLKLYVKETKNFVDIYHYKINEEDKTVQYLFTFLDSPFPESWKKSELKCMKPVAIDAVFPLKKAKFDNLTVWAPNNVVTFLQSKYGENLDPAMLWDEETKTYLKVENHPYYED